MICPPCRRAADLESAAIRHDPGYEPAGHDPGVCRDSAVQPAGCPCDHRPVHAPQTPQEPR